MHVSDFDYELPPELIAQVPIEPRDSARLLDALSKPGSYIDRQVSDFSDLIGPGDVVVVNNSKVMPCRLELFKGTGGLVEVLLVRHLEGSSLVGQIWEVLIRPMKRCPSSTELLDQSGEKVCKVVGRKSVPDGRDLAVVEFEKDIDPHRLASVAFPPYIHTKDITPERYQTVFARQPGSVAAPTAGLHFTDSLMRKIVTRGAKIVTVELQIGLDTFRPIVVDDPSLHHIHSENYFIDERDFEEILSANRVLAIGTTTTRALESAATFEQLSGSTNLYIYGDYDFKVVDVMLTNFHVPRSTLLVMLQAFCGNSWRNIYRYALESKYRFLSFGDAMIVGRSQR